MGNINYQERIPNNVDLSTDRRLQRALEAWQPDYLDWWMEMGPEAFRTTRSISERPSRSNETAGLTSTTWQCPNIAGASF